HGRRNHAATANDRRARTRHPRSWLRACPARQSLPPYYASAKWDTRGATVCGACVRVMLRVSPREVVESRCTPYSSCHVILRLLPHVRDPLRMTALLTTSQIEIRPRRLR